MDSTKRTKSVDFLLDECTAEQQGGNNEIAGIEKSLSGLSSSAVVVVRKWISLTSLTGERDLRIRAQNKTTPKIISNAAKN